jgi:MFS family permease
VSVVLPRLFLAPATSRGDVRHNWQATQKEALAFGPSDAASSFLPVLLARLGASNVQVGLLSALPALAGFVLALPVGHFLQGRRNVVPWYSRGRLINQLSLAAIGFTLVAFPGKEAVPLILVIIGLGAIVASFANFSFYAVMDGLSAAHGRYELMGRRWGMKGAATAVSLAVIGWILAEVPFPQSYQLVFIATAVAALTAYRYASTFRIPDQPPQPSRAGVPTRTRASAFVREVAGERRFLGFLGRHAVFAFGLSMAVPLIPLYYVRQLGASDAWIGLIGTTQALLTMAGYFLWRRPARQRGGAWVLVPSTIGAGLFPAMLAVTHQELLVAVLVGGYGISLAGIELAIFDELLKAVPPGQAVRFAALDQGASNFSAMTGPITGALIAAQAGIPAGLLAAAVVSLIGAGLFGASVALRARNPTARTAPSAQPIGSAASEASVERVAEG